MIREITSTKNKTVCEVKKLKQKKYREETGTFLAEGYRNVADSMKLRAPRMLFLEQGMTGFSDIQASVDVFYVTEDVMKELCDTKTPQGVAGVFEIPQECPVSKDQILLLNGVSDPGNLGTILRTALAAGFTDIVLDEQCADVFSPKVVRSAMSAIFSLNLIRVKNLDTVLKSLQDADYKVYGAALSKEAKSIYETNFSKKTALLFGSEANGIEDRLLSLVDGSYIIPMCDGIESLNVAVAAGISMYEVVRDKNL